MLGFKEAFFMVGVTLGIAVWLLKKDWRKTAVNTIMLSFLWGYISIRYIIPAFSQGIYIYQPILPPGIIPKVVALVDQPEKIHTLLMSAASFGFLPLFSPAFYASFLQDYALRFLPVGFQTRWGLGMHYNALSAVLLAIGSVYAVSHLKRVLIGRKSWIICGLIIIGVFSLNRFKLQGPFHLVYNPAFYAHVNNFHFLNDLIAQVPRDGTVMAQNNLAGRFTRQTVYLLSPSYAAKKPDYIVMDTRDGQAGTNFFGSKVEQNGKDIVFTLKRDPNYEKVYATQEQFIFKRIR
jgi:uncharacterized membrane protein